MKTQPTSNFEDDQGLICVLPVMTTVKLLNFRDARKVGCNLPKIQTNQPNLSVFRQKDTDGIANSEDPDQTAPLGAV